MRKLLFSFLLLLGFISLKAQIWADSGAVWHYGSGGIINQGFVEITYTHDTVILGYDAEQLKVTKSGFNYLNGVFFESMIGFEYTYSDSDHVYILHNGQFEVLYDFSAEVGDTLIHFLPNDYYIQWCDSIGKSVVSATGTEIINNEELRWYETEYVDGISALDGRVYEKIGALDYMFPTNYLCGIDEDYYNPFRCYQDDDFGLYQNPEYEGECDFIYEFPISNYFENDPEWCGSWWFIDECNHHHQTVHYINGDSLVNNLSYKKLFSRGQFTVSSNIETCFQNGSFNYLEALIRQEGEKIYTWDSETQLDKLMYDFTLSIGDTIPPGFTSFENGYYNEIFPLDEGPFIVTNIDSIYLYDNYYKRFYFSSQLFEEAYYIEGIGHTLGFVWPFWQANFGAELIDYRILGDFSLYHFQGNETCDFSVSINENEEIKFNFEIYPNPVVDKLQLKGIENGSLKSISIYSISGKLITNLSPQEIIDVSTLTSGMYLLEIESVDGYRAVERFVKK